MAYGNYAPFYRGQYFNPMQTPAMPNMENQNMQTAQPYQPQFGQPYQQPMMNQQNAVPQPIDERIWVNGEVGARAHLLAPNVTLPLWDSDANYIYLKSSDSTGKMAMVKYKLVEETYDADKSQGNGATKHECTCGKEFVRIKDFDELRAKYEELEGIVKSMTEKPKTTASKSTKSKTEEE
jgi:hypothetical protein